MPPNPFIRLYVLLWCMLGLWTPNLHAQTSSATSTQLAAEAAQVVRLVPATAPIYTQTAVLVDAAGTETIDSIRQRPAHDFQPLQRPLSAGFSRDVHWLRLSIRPTQALSVQHQWLLEVRPAYHDDVRLYVPDTHSNDAGFVTYQSGDLLPFDSRTIAHRFFVFPLPLTPDTQLLTVYLRVQSTSTHAVNLSIYERTAFNKASQGEYLALGLQLGALLCMAIYSMLHWRLLRKQFLFLFLGLLLSIAVATFGISGLASQLLFPTQPVLASQMAPLGTCMFTFFGLWFYLNFFKVWERFPWFSRLSCLTMGLSVLGIVGVFFDFYVEIAPWILLLSVISMPFYLLIVWQSIGGKFFGGLWIAAAHSWFCVVMVLNQLSVTGLISGPAWSNDWHFNSLVYLMLLMSGVVSRTREVEQQHEIAVAQSIEAETKAEIAAAQREEKSRFLSLVAHELKTPLATIDAAVQALGYSGAATDSSSAKRHQRIRSAVKQLNTLLEDALQIARSDIHPSAIMVRSDPIDLTQLEAALREHCATIDVQTNAGAVQFDWPPINETLYGDSMLLRRALSNLLDNALKYGAPDQPIHMQVLPQKHLGKSGIAFTITNAFIGDLHQDCETWFQKYARGRQTGSTEGWGLGLYLVRSIANAHAGYAWCHTSPRSEGEHYHRLIATLWLPLKGNK